MAEAGCYFLISIFPKLSQHIFFQQPCPSDALIFSPLSWLVILISFVLIQKDCISLSLYFSDEQLLELLEANVVLFLIISNKEASVHAFLKLYEPGISCAKLVDQIIEKPKRMSHLLWICNLLVTPVSHFNKRENYPK